MPELAYGSAVLSKGDLARVGNVRATSPETILSTLKARTRRPLLLDDERLLIIAADHPARGALAAGGRPMAMANRYDLLERLALALSRPGVDGVLGTPDILEDLALLGVLENKVAVGSMNRGGLSGASFEMDDRFTGYNVDSLASSRIDFAKLLVRINFEDAATARTLERSAQAVTSSASAGLPIMIEPFVSQWVDNRIQNDLSPDAVIRSMAIAAAVGATSAYSWLKIPVVSEMERVMEAATLPTLLLGGDTRQDWDKTLSAWEHALTLRGARGLVAGRVLLYPSNDDVAGAVDDAARLVHPA